MNMQELMQRAHVWRAGEVLSRTLGIPSGFAALDEVLPGGGWPQKALTEILFPRHGVGELSLLLPALARLSQGGRWIAFVAPPYLPYAPALARAGVDLSRLLLIHPKSTQDGLWAVEQTLRAGTCAAVLTWLTTVEHKHLRRLQLAAEAGQAWGVVFRPDRFADSSSPAALRLRVAADTTAQGQPQRVNVSVLKRIGGWPTGPVALTVGAAAKRVCHADVRRVSVNPVPATPGPWPRTLRG
jgi:cell division inhibitor SulA